MEISLLLDIILVALLSITIGYAVLLNRRLGSLRKDRDQLEKMALNFHASTDRAENSISRLKNSGEALRNILAKSESLRDDLIFLCDSGTSSADRLEAAIRAARPISISEPSIKSDELSHSKKVATTSEIRRGNADRKRMLNLRKKSSLDEKGGQARAEKTGISNEEFTDAEKQLLKALRSAN